MRKPFICGNWKMNKTVSEALAFVHAVKELVEDVTAIELGVAPAFTALSAVVEACRGTNLRVGAQNCHWEKSGAFTGEVSAAMLKETGVSFVILGHSERRQYFGETDETVGKRAKAAVGAGLTAVVCVGETLSERKADETFNVVGRQTKVALAGFTAADFDRIVIAYEPVWAIGTGEVATDAQAQEVHAFIRGLLAEVFGADVAAKTRILYGGSMNDCNAAGLLAQPDIDGGLIGGASLVAEKFAAIATAAIK